MGPQTAAKPTTADPKAIPQPDINQRLAMEKIADIDFISRTDTIYNNFRLVHPDNRREDARAADRTSLNHPWLPNADTGDLAAAARSRFSPSLAESFRTTEYNMRKAIGDLRAVKLHIPGRTDKSFIAPEIPPASSPDFVRLNIEIPTGTATDPGLKFGMNRVRSDVRALNPANAASPEYKVAVAEFAKIIASNYGVSTSRAEEIARTGKYVPAAGPGLPDGVEFPKKVWEVQLKALADGAQRGRLMIAEFLTPGPESPRYSGQEAVARLNETRFMRESIARRDDLVKKAQEGVTSKTDPKTVATKAETLVRAYAQDVLASHLLISPSTAGGPLSPDLLKPSPEYIAKISDPALRAQVELSFLKIQGLAGKLASAGVTPLEFHLAAQSKSFTLLETKFGALPPEAISHARTEVKKIAGVTAEDKAAWMALDEKPLDKLLTKSKPPTAAELISANKSVSEVIRKGVLLPMHLSNAGGALALAVEGNEKLSVGEIAAKAERICKEYAEAAERKLLSKLPTSAPAPVGPQPADPSALPPEVVVGIKVGAENVAKLNAAGLTKLQIQAPLMTSGLDEFNKTVDAAAKSDSTKLKRTEVAKIAASSDATIKTLEAKTGIARVIGDRISPRNLAANTGIAALITLTRGLILDDLKQGSQHTLFPDLMGATKLLTRSCGYQPWSYTVGGDVSATTALFLQTGKTAAEISLMAPILSRLDRGVTCLTVKTAESLGFSRTAGLAGKVGVVGPGLSFVTSAFAQANVPLGAQHDSLASRTAATDVAISAGFGGAVAGPPGAAVFALCSAGGEFVGASFSYFANERDISASNARKAAVETLNLAALGLLKNPADTKTEITPAMRTVIEEHRISRFYNSLKEGLNFNDTKSELTFDVLKDIFQASEGRRLDKAESLLAGVGIKGIDRIRLETALSVACGEGNEAAAVCTELFEKSWPITELDVNPSVAHSRDHQIEKLNVEFLLMKTKAERDGTFGTPEYEKQVEEFILTRIPMITRAMFSPATAGYLAKRAPDIFNTTFVQAELKNVEDFKEEKRRESADPSNPVIAAAPVTAATAKAEKYGDRFLRLFKEGSMEVSGNTVETQHIVKRDGMDIYVLRSEAHDAGQHLYKVLEVGFVGGAWRWRNDPSEGWRSLSDGYGPANTHKVYKLLNDALARLETITGQNGRPLAALVVPPAAPKVVKDPAILD